MFAKRLWLAYASVAILGCGAGTAALGYWQTQYKTASADYVSLSSGQTQMLVDKVETAFSAIYQNIRTLSLLPSVRTIDRQGTTLTEEAKTTIQQIYNNLATDVAVSEVYILPVDFDPEKIDPATGRHERPILAFDQLIAPNQSRESDSSTQQQLTADQDFVGEPDEAGFPQVEIDEYRLLKEQLEWLSANYPTIDKIDGMKVPMIGGREVVTCDNSEYDATKNDADRRGLIQLVPFYGIDGKIKGGVAAIMRSNAYRNLLPDRDFALVNGTFGFASRSTAGGQDVESSKWVDEGKPDPNLIYSEAIPFSTADVTSKWTLWAGHSNAEFELGPRASEIRYSQWGSVLAIALLALGAGAVIFLVAKNARNAAAASAQLERRVEERTVEVQTLAAANVDAERRAATTRASMMEELGHAFGQVVDAAREGDFSQRVPEDFSDSELNRLAVSVNGLLDTVQRGLEETGSVLSALARTDLTTRVAGNYGGAFAKLKDDTNSVADKLAEIVGQLKASSESLASATNEMLTGANDLSDRTSRQAATIEQTSAAIEQLHATVTENASSAVRASTEATVVSQTAQSSGEAMAKATQAMSRIIASSTKISNIISVIDDIAFQTNLLALNASVEAARAGDAGKGFAVVAVEVRRLAQQAAQASGQVKALVDESTFEVEGGTRLVENVATKLRDVLDGIDKTAAALDRLASASRDQASSIGEVNTAVREMDQMTQQNAALVEQMNAALEQTESQSSDIASIANLFHTGSANRNRRHGRDAA